MKLLSILAGFSLLFVIIIKFIFGNTPEFIELGEELGDVINDLAIGYISAYIFYLIDIYLPKLNEKKKLQERISIPLSRVLDSIKSPIDHIIYRYGDENYTFNNITEEEFKDIINKMDLIEVESPMQTHDLKRTSYGHYLLVHVERINKYIKQINENPHFIEVDLFVILDEIRNSSYHELMIGINNHGGFRYMDPNVIIKGGVIADLYYKYYLLFFKLKKYMETNKIKFTIEHLKN